MSRRTSRRTRKEIDYSKIGEIEGIEEEELGGRLHKEVPSESDEYELDEGKDGANHDDDGSDMDVIAEDEEAEEEDEEEEDNYGEVIEVRKPARSTRPPTRPFSIQPNLPDAADLQELSLGQSRKLKESRMPKPAVLRPSKTPGSRAESLKERFQLFYGSNDVSNVYAINQRIKWGSQIFIPEPSLLEIPEEIVELSSKPLNDYFRPKGDQSLQLTSVHDVISYLPDNSIPMKVQTDLDSNIQIPLSCFEPTFIHKNAPHAGFIVRAGNTLVSSARWAPGFQESQIQYLAVSVLVESTTNTSVYEEIAGHSTTASPSCIQIYRLDTSVGRNAANASDFLQLMAVYCTDYGPITKLAWRPLGPQSPSHIGLLVASCQDGKVRLVDIEEPKTLPQYYKINSFLKEYSLESKITCLAWRTINSIVVGTIDGCIGEFDITDESPTGTLPSFCVPVHNSFINAIETCFPHHEHLIFTCATDGYNRLVDVHDVLRTKSISVRFKGYATCLSYSYHLRSFISLEDAFTTKITPIRRLNILQAATNATRHDATVTSVAGSYLHPMILSGGADGTLHIGNAIRRSTVSKRQTNAVYKETVLWEFDAPEKLETMSKFVDVLRAKDLPKAPAIERQFIYPRKSLISALEWNQNKIAGSWYVAATSSGLLRIENLALGD